MRQQAGKPQKPAVPGSIEWKQQVAELRVWRRQMRQVARALGLDPDSAKGTIVWEFLLHKGFGRVAHNKRGDTAAIRQLLNLLKSAPAKAASPRRKSSAADRKSLTHHLEQLYGPGVVVVEDVDDEEETEDSPPKKAR